MLPLLITVTLREKRGREENKKKKSVREGTGERREWEVIMRASSWTFLAVCLRRFIAAV